MPYVVLKHLEDLSRERVGGVGVGPEGFGIGEVGGGWRSGKDPKARDIFGFDDYLTLVFQPFIPLLGEIS